MSQTEYPDFTFAAENSVDAVVYVEVTVRNEQQYQINDPFFKFFFGDDMGSQPRESKGSGSGVIIREDGYIVTNHHVIAGATSLEVTLNNDKKYPATIIGSDSVTDVALIKIDAKGLPFLEFDDSDNLRLGEWVLAIGSPYGIGLRSTITAGIVSAKGRSIPGNSREFKIESFIQTDAAVNPGNSGGALVNRAGKLVGVNTAIISQTGSYTGYSFAIPSNIVKRITNDLIKYGSVRRARLGITMTAIDQKIADQMKLSSLEGVYIVEVSKGSAAEKAGLREKDVILSIDGKSVKGTSALQERVNSYHPGDKAEFGIVRDGKRMNVNVTFYGESTQTGTVASDGTTMFYGAKLRAARPETLAALSINSGVEIVSAGTGKLASAGAEDGIVIRYVNDQPVKDPADVLNAASKAKRSVVIEGITRSGRSVFFAVAKE
ncbi:MAG: Do family serine endopeptidase [Bacteroidales bacterium]|nr:Do family serine endopeptidase [Bacteroidales bacterium]